MRKAVFVLSLVLSTPAVHAAGWGQNSLWDDGRAEVAVYDSERIVYDKVRSFREQLITVQEDLRADTLVKSDNPKATKNIRVFKLNNAQRFETQNYPYSYLTSIYVKENPVSEVVKLTVGGQEWCGNTFKMYKGGAQGGVLTWHSYFDGEADESQSIELQPNDYFEDQLPLSLRGLDFKVGLEQKIRLWGYLTTNRAVPLEPKNATLRVKGEEIIRTRNGSIPSWIVTITKSEGVDTYWFEKKYPNILTKMVTTDGRTRLLHGRVRWKYWDRRLPPPDTLK